MADNRPRRKPQSKQPEAMLSIDGRVPPQAIDFEVAVLGAILLEKDAYSRVSEILVPEAFYVKAHEEIYRAITTLSLAQHPVDILTVSEELKRMGKLDEVGGVAYISELTLKVLSSASIEYHAQILANKYLSRRLISYSTETLRDAYDDTEEVSEQLQRAEGKLFEIAQNRNSKEFQELSFLVKETREEIQAAANRPEGLSGLSSSFKGIDKITNGWQRSDLIIIAARPAMGKTAFVVSMAKNMAVEHNTPVALFNLEMSSIQLVKRILSNACEINGQTIKNGRLSDEEWKRLDIQTTLLSNAPLYINDTPSLSIFELRSKSRRLVREHGVKMIIIDYLQLMNASGMGFGNREQEVSMISRALKMLAKELNIPIIALSQLNRSVETRQGDANSKRPQLSDLRESGAIEQDADIVCFIHRPEYYKIYEDAYGNSLKGVAEFIIAKHRNGPVEDARLLFKNDYAKFTDYDATERKRLAGESDEAPRVARRAFGSNNTQVDFDNPSGFPAGIPTGFSNPIGGGDDIDPSAFNA